MPDALELLRQQHDEVKEIFKKFSDTDDKNTRKSLAQQAMVQLEVHTKLEEDIFYPAVRAEGSINLMMDEALEEHHVADLLMDELRRLPASDPRYEAKFDVFAEGVRHHIEEEESEIFPKATEMGHDKLQQLGEEMERRKPELMKDAQKPRRTTTARRPAASRGRTTTRTTTARGRKAGTGSGARAGSTPRRAAGTTRGKNGAARTTSTRTASRSSAARHTDGTRASGTRSTTRSVSSTTRTTGTKTGRTPSRSCTAASSSRTSRTSTRSTTPRSRGASEPRRRQASTRSRSTSTPRR